MPVAANQRSAAARSLPVHDGRLFGDHQTISPALGLSPFNQTDQRVALQQEVRRIDLGELQNGRHDVDQLHRVRDPLRLPEPLRIDHHEGHANHGHEARRLVPPVAVLAHVLPVIRQQDQERVVCKTERAQLFEQAWKERIVVQDLAGIA